MLCHCILILGIWALFFTVGINGCTPIKHSNLYHHETEIADFPDDSIDQRSHTVNCCEVFNRISGGWYGFRWGASKIELQSLFPSIQCLQGDRFLVREKYRTEFCGCQGKPCYGFNRMNQFAWVMLIPDMADRCQIKEKMIEVLGPGIGSDAIWRRESLQIEVNPVFHTVIITNMQFDEK